MDLRGLLENYCCQTAISEFQYRIVNELPLPDPPVNTLASLEMNAPTKWSLVWRAGHATTKSMRVALEEICRTYWMPVYSFIRRRGQEPQDAEDLTQAFFCHLLQKKWFATADPSRGKLRSFLYASLTNFLASDYEYNHAAKRGGGFLHVEFSSAESNYQITLADHLTPDLAFQRRWALDALEKALTATRDYYLSAGPNPLFEALYPRLRDPADDDQTEAAISAQLGVSYSNVRTTLHRMRQTFRHQLFLEVGQTIASMDPDEIRAEMRSLMEFL